MHEAFRKKLNFQAEQKLEFLKNLRLIFFMIFDEGFMVFNKINTPNKSLT